METRELRARLETLQDELKTVRGTSIDDEVAALEQEFVKLTARQAELTEKKQALRGELATATSELAEAREQLSRARSEVSQLEYLGPDYDSASDLGEGPDTDGDSLPLKAELRVVLVTVALVAGIAFVFGGGSCL